MTGDDRTADPKPPALVVTNQLAGGTESDAVGAALAVLRTGFRLDVEVCRSPGELDELLTRHPHRTVISAGGDGSLHTLVGALWRRGETASRVVGLLPLGTGNDFARGLGIPLRPQAAARALIDGVPTGLDLLVDEHDRVAVNAVHVGVGAAAARAAAPVKPLLRRLAFPLGAVWAGLTSPGWRWSVEVDGVALAHRRRRVLMVAVANGPSIAGGGATIGPSAVATDGLADITVSHAVGLWQRLRYGFRLRRGAHPRDEAVTYLRGRHVLIAGEDIWVNADGEIRGPTERCTWTVRPAAWRLLLRPQPPTNRPEGGPGRSPGRPDRQPGDQAE